MRAEFWRARDGVTMYHPTPAILHRVFRDPLHRKGAHVVVGVNECRVGIPKADDEGLIHA